MIFLIAKNDARFFNSKVISKLNRMLEELSFSNPSIVDFQTVLKQEKRSRIIPQALILRLHYPSEYQDRSSSYNQYCLIKNKPILFS